ncbi:MAG: hypothetical protein ACI89J_001013 [Hyphomicrobiaceae bacterium]|jgi:hypothetical protein
MELNRRNFFGVAAASPLAAKETAARVIEAAEMEASGMSVYGDSLYTGINSYGFDLDESDDTPMRTLWDAIKDIGMPDWKKDDLWSDAKRSRTIDPDIASMRSLSMNAKLQMQWKRNYELLIDRAYEQQVMERKKRKFFEKHKDVQEY